MDFVNRKVSCIFLLIVSVWVNGITGYGTGAPATPAICEKMLPGHGVEPQKSTPPYEIRLSNTSITGGETTRITLVASESEDTEEESYFKGFLAMVKKPGNDGVNYGTFISTAEPESQTIDCFGQQKNAITHNSASEKSGVFLDWVAPNTDIDISDLELVVTFVREANEIWQAVRHPQKISVKKNIQATPPVLIRFEQKE